MAQVKKKTFEASRKYRGIPTIWAYGARSYSNILFSPPNIATIGCGGVPCFHAPVVRVIICLTETKHTIRRLFWRRVACYSVADQYPEIMTSRNLETAHRKGEGVLARVVHRALLHEKGPQSGPPYPSLCPKVLDASIVARVQIQHFHGYIGYPSCRRRCASATHSKV